MIADSSQQLSELLGLLPAFIFCALLFKVLNETG